jgi:hypothetical protein
MLKNNNIISRCNVTSTDLSVERVMNPKSPARYDFPDLSFHMLYHQDDLIGIIELIRNEVAVTFKFVHLAPANLFPPNYFSSIKLFTELSRKFQSAYNIIKESLIPNPTSITPAKKKVYTSSPLVSNSFTPASPILPASPVSSSPTPPSPADELDELLKLRQVINMVGDGNCTVYAIMSQLYPQTYRGYRLCPDDKSQLEVDRTITYDRNVQATVQEIRGVAIQKLSQKRPADYTNTVEEESFNAMLHSEYLTANHLVVLAQHYNRVIVVINTHPTQHMTNVYFPKEGHEFSASLIKGTNDMSAYHLPIQMRFNGVHTVRILEFITYVNNYMGTKFTPQTTLYEVIRAVLQLNYCIAYINVGVHSWSLQSFARNMLADYAPKPIDISGVTNSSIKNLTDLPLIQNNNPANVSSAPQRTIQGQPTSSVQPTTTWQNASSAAQRTPSEQLSGNASSVLCCAEDIVPSAAAAIRERVLCCAEDIVPRAVEDNPGATDDNPIPAGAGAGAAGAAGQLDPSDEPVELRNGANGAEEALTESVGTRGEPEENEDDNLAKAEDDNPEDSSAGV